MGRINVLGFDVANLIAAGEVVDRPSSVVKELLENSVDAGATAITVEIQRGGVAFIRISDNGCGMEPDELPVSILRHATSKISDADDLSHISTLGFRGEALAAISSVSKIRIFSKPRESIMGAVLTAEGGEVIDITETGCADGTTVVVEDLFYNVPARRKFLKKDTTEAVAVGSLVEKIALSRPDIAIKYICDGETKFFTAGDGKLYSAIYAVFGRDTASRSLEVDRSADGVRVSGYISEPDLFKSNRNMENFFINGRYVKSKTAIAAVEQAYKTLIPSDKFPFCVLNIDISPAAVDVNVHPAKLEVKFTNERIIFESVYYAVKSALEASSVRPELTIAPVRTTPRTAEPGRIENKSNFWQTPTRAEYLSSRGEEPKKPEEKPEPKHDSSFWIDGDEAKRLLGAFVPADVREKAAPQEKISFREAPETPKVTEVCAVKSAAQLKKELSELTSHRQYDIEFSSGEESGDPAYSEPKQLPSREKLAGAVTGFDSELSADEIPEYVVLGEAYNCYVIVQLEDRLLFIDKHAAHERIIFDELCRRMKQAEHAGQILLAPLSVPLLEIEADAAEEYAEKIRSMGFDFTLTRDGVKCRAEIKEIPDMLSNNEAVELFSTLASHLCDIGAGADAAAEEFFAAKLFQSACKAAIKGGRIYDAASIRWICDRLLVKPKPGGSVVRSCPHGRPVAFEVKKSSIDRQFGRLQ